MKLWFSKYEALGNDFIIIDMRVPQGGEKFSPQGFAKKYCSRKFGIGADGVLLLLPPSSDEFDYKMRVFNSDGSEAEMSGNGIRCLAQYIFDMKINKSDTIKIETLAGKRTVQKTENGLKVDMGVPKIVSEISFGELRGIKVDTGNPHIVFFGDFSYEEFLKIGEKVSKEYNVNVEFASVQGNEVKAFVWERGVGETLACGTGATAIVKAGVEKNLLPKNKEIKIKFPGGTLIAIQNDYNNIFIEGKANFVFSGYINL